MSQDWLKLSVPVFAHPPALWHRHCHKNLALQHWASFKVGVVSAAGVTPPVFPPLHEHSKDAHVSAFRAKEIAVFCPTCTACGAVLS